MEFNMTRFLFLVIFLKLDRSHFTRISVLNTIYLRDRGNFTWEHFQNILLKNYVSVHEIVDMANTRSKFRFGKIFNSEDVGNPMLRDFK